MKPELKELKEYKDYDIVPVYEELFSDSTTPLNVLRNIKEISDQFYLLESVDPSSTTIISRFEKVWVITEFKHSFK